MVPRGGASLGLLCAWPALSLREETCAQVWPVHLVQCGGLCWEQTLLSALSGKFVFPCPVLATGATAGALVLVPSCACGRCIELSLVAGAPLSEFEEAAAHLPACRPGLRVVEEKPDRRQFTRPVCA